jgi:hypothetical protein
MTDEQWLWLFVNESIDRDEKLEHMCPTCRGEATSKNIRCTRCGKPIGISDDSFTNPNFNIDRYNALANGTDEYEEHNHHEDLDDDDISYDELDNE